MRRYRERKLEDQVLGQEDAPILPSGEWREIPGYGGAYEISWEGQVRSYRWRGAQLTAKPHPLTAYMRKRGKCGRALFVKLTDEHGKAREVKVLSLVVDVWLGGNRPGLVPYHKNGIPADNYVSNIGFITRKALGQKTGAKSRRKPVAKVTPDGEVVAIYPSARRAAAANHMSYQTVLDRCNKKVKNPFALDGTTYVFDK